jgi:arabinan endo-1,5-alpha-L-arabinosidase
MELSGAITGCHDPSHIVKDSSGVYWIYSTAPNLNARVSTDLENWDGAPRAFRYRDGVPPWMDTILTGLEGDVGPWNLWAPDMLVHNGQFYLYYSRNMGSDNDVEISGCGVAIGTSLEERDWIDQGEAITTDLFQDHFRVIDPTVVFDRQGRLWMAVGSFGSPTGQGFVNGGIRIFELDPATGKRLVPGDQGTRIAGSWIEAPFLIFHDGFYYLFFNQGRCCAGLGSTYYIRVGRSESIAGPYFDMHGNSLLQTDQGGSLFMGRDETANYDGNNPADNFGSVGREIGPGHVGVLEGEDGFDRFTYHYYNGDDFGNPTLGLRTLIWTESGWPRPGWDLPDGNYIIANQAGDTTGSLHGEAYLDLIHETGPTPVTQGWDGSWSQIWTIERVGFNDYRVRSTRTDRVLAAVAGGTVRLVVYDSGDELHRWFIEQTSDASFRLINRGTGEALNLAGDEVGATPWANEASQRWWITPTGIHTLTNDYSGLAAGVANEDPETRVDQFDYFASPLQQWRVIPLRGGFSRIESVGSGLVLGLADGQLLNTLAVEQQADTNATTQQWSFEPLPDGSRRILNRASAMVLDIPNPDPLSPARQTRWLHVRNQQWTPSLLEVSPLGAGPEPSSSAADEWMNY